MTLARTPLALAALAALAAAGCRGPKAEHAPSATAAPAAALDWSRPEALLSPSGDAVAARAGSFDWAAQVTWTASRGAGSRAVAAVERHSVRQLASGEFELDTVVDPGKGPEGETGRTIVFAGGVTYGRSRYGEFRQRATDRGRDARRFRDESLGVVGDLVRLGRGAIRLVPAGEGTERGRPVRRFRLALDEAAAVRAPPQPPGRAEDADTKARLELLETANAISAAGALALDAASGLLVRAELRVAYGVPSDPQLRLEVAVDAAAAAVGGAVAAVRAPAGALPDERKPDGPARALEAAGLRERGRRVPEEQGEPEDEGTP